jgi:hypothetical protein
MPTLNAAKPKRKSVRPEGAVLCIVGNGIAKAAELALGLSPITARVLTRAATRVDAARAEKMTQLTAELDTLMTQMASLPKQAIAMMTELRRLSQPLPPTPEPPVS